MVKNTFLPEAFFSFCLGISICCIEYSMPESPLPESPIKPITCEARAFSGYTLPGILSNRMPASDFALITSSTAVFCDLVIFFFKYKKSEAALFIAAVMC